MANLTLIPFLILFIFSPLTIARQSQNTRTKTKAYIESSCRHTRYPRLCLRSLGGYAEAANLTILTSKDLAQLALSYSLYRARTTRTFLLRATKKLKDERTRDSRALHDCLAQIDMSVNGLYRSMKELHEFARETPSRYRDRYEISWHISNMESWVGSALTGATSCGDEIRGKRMSKLKATVKAKVLNVAEVTSVALALFHRFASRYRKP